MLGKFSTKQSNFLKLIHKCIYVKKLSFRISNESFKFEQSEEKNGVITKGQNNDDGIHIQWLRLEPSTILSILLNQSNLSFYFFRMILYNQIYRKSNACNVYYSMDIDIGGMPYLMPIRRPRPPSMNFVICASPNLNKQMNVVVWGSWYKLKR